MVGLSWWWGQRGRVGGGAELAGAELVVGRVGAELVEG